VSFLGSAGVPGGVEGGGASPPVDDMVTQVALEHETPALDGVKQGLFEGAAVTLQPAVEHLGVLTLGHLLVQLLIGVDLENSRWALSRSPGGAPEWLGAGWVLVLWGHCRGQPPGPVCGF
jgi:hypothetical protein